jgi:hypothetical protein
MQRMTEPGAVQRAADSVPMTAKGREHNRQYVFESVTRPIEPGLTAKACHDAFTRVANPILSTQIPSPT